MEELVNKSYIFFIAILKISLSISATYAQSADRCDLLLQHGINNITRYKSADHAISYKWHKNCGIDFNSSSDSVVNRAGIEIFGYVGGSGSTNTNEQRRRIQQWCTENSAFASKNSDLFEESQELSMPALTAWTQCIDMARKDIFITMNPNGENDEFIHFTIDSTHDGILKYFGVKSLNYECEEKMSKHSGENLNPDDHPDITQSNIQIDCIRSKPDISESNGIGTIKFDAGYISVNTSGPSMSVAFPQVVEQYTVTPPKSILSFNSTSCPAGWKPYENSGGRFLLGATPEFPLGTAGGRRNIALGERELPSHNHNFLDGFFPEAQWVGNQHGIVHYKDLPGWDRWGNTGNDGDNTIWAAPSTTDLKGAGQPFDILPPFKTVTFCEKL